MLDRVQSRAVGFAGLTAAIFATALMLSPVLSSTDRPDALVLAIGITLDLTIIVPAAYYFLVVRPRGWPPVAVAPVIVLSLLAASLVIPAEHHQALRLIEALAIPMEVGLLGWIGVQAARAMRRASGNGAADPLDELQRSAREILRVKRPADVLATELAVFLYALGAWRRSPHVPPGTWAFTSHRRSGLGGLVLAVMMITTVEVAAVHFLVASWSPIAAWILTLLSLYGALWLLADYRATVLRPVLAGAREVCFRSGLRWRARVGRDVIARVERRDPGPEAGAVSLELLITPNLWIEFTQPVVLEGPYGLQRSARWIAICVDEPRELQQALAAD